MAERGLDGIEVLLIDGNNLLHRVKGTADPAAQRTLIPRLRGAIPTTIATVMMLDGYADSGTSRVEKVGKGFEIRHSGSMTADDAILRLIDGHAPSGRSEITVVTDDRGLTEKARHLGALTERLSWLEQLIGLPPGKATGIGAGKPPAKGPPTPPRDEDREPWKPGRGATKKRGNPRRGHPHPRETRP